MNAKKYKIKIGMAVAIFVIVLSGIIAIIFLSYVSPSKDNIDTSDYPPEFFCRNEKTHIDYQTDGKCASYASAYILRYLGEDIDGEKLFPELKRQFGFVSTNSITNVFKHHGHQATAYHGNIETLKKQLTHGNPLIVFIRIPGDTHYAVVVGYDEHNIYLVDSLMENTNTLDARYNRIMTTKDFEDVWQNGTLLPNNIYIVVES